MEAPKKIYIRVKDGKAWSIWNSEWVGVNDIEYTRTDVFIGKVEEFIYSALNGGIMGTANIEGFMKLFKNIWRGKV